MTKAAIAETYTALQWVVDELKLEVGQALRSLEDFVEKDDGNQEKLDECIQHLSQIAGIFAVTGVPLPSQLCTELQELASKYNEISSVSADDCLGVLAEAILALGVYLNNPASNAIKLAAQVNNVRALQDRELLTESSVFAPNIEAGLRAFQNRADQPLESRTLRKLRMLYQRSVLSVIKDGISEEALSGMQKVFKVLYQMGGTAYLSAVGYSCSALADRLSHNQLSLNPAINATFKRIDEVLRKLIAGENYEDAGLLKNVLFYVAIGTNHSGTAEKVVKAFVLGAYSTEGSEDQGDFSASSGLEPELVSRVVEALQTEVEQAKTWLDDCLHQTCDFGEAIQNVEAILKRVDDTLVMVNTDEPRTITRQLLDMLIPWREYADESAISPDELDQFATAVVNLENSLVTLTENSRSTRSDEGSYGSAAATIIKESRASLANIKDSISEFIEGSTDWEALNDVPANLAMVEGALRFYPLKDLSNVINCIRRYVRESLLAEKRSPEQAEIDLFADVVVAIDYYLECLERGTAFNLDFLIERASDNCSRLGFPVQGFESVTEEPVAEAPAIPEATEELAEQHEEQPETAQETEQEAPVAVSADADADDPNAEESAAEDEPEDEIVEIFIEEAEELLPMASEQLVAWKEEDNDALMDLRRGFHTLKGGGRMVGATTIGELSWSLENLLNRVIDKTVPTQNEIYEVAEQALGCYPDLLSALSQGKAADESPEVARIRETAFALADPNAVRAEEPATENSELTETFLREAEELRESIVKSTAELSTGSEDSEVIESLMISVHTLTDCARNAEFDDIADSLKPLHQILRHYSSIGDSLSNELITLLSIWSGKFSECLSSLRAQGQADAEPLTTIGEQCIELLHKEEKDLAQHSSNRKKRFRPLHRLMAEELERLIIAEQIIQDWRVGQPDAEQLAALSEDLSSLSETAEMCQVDEVSELCSSIIAFQSVTDANEALSEEKTDCLLRSYDQLLIMLDAVASWLVVPKVPQTLLDELDRLSSVEPEEAPETDTSDAPAEEETSVPEAAEDLPAEEEEAPQEEVTEVAASSDYSEDDLDLDEQQDDEFERELMETFLEEGEDLVRDIDTSLKSWREAPSNYNHADSIHRALHTLKGGARLSGLPELGNMSHDFESFIIDQQVMRNADEHFFRVALDRLDSLNAHLEAVRNSSLAGGPIVEPKAPESIVTSTVVPLTPEAEEPTAEPVEVEAEATEEKPLAAGSEAEESISEPTEQELVKAATLEEAAADAVRRELRQETVRLRSETLDEMVNLAGESTVYRGRIEAQLNSIDGQLDELESTINRIQQLARRLDVETEAQINFRTEQIAESEEQLDFDPLEMDRYSTLQQLSRQLIESASDLQDLRTTLSEGTRDTNTLVIQSSRILGELNDQLLSTRMVPFTQLVPRLERIARQVSRELEKSVELTALNVEGELDRQVLEQILPPLEHIIRNSIDHGIEDASTREAAGKDRRGHIYLNIRREGSYTVMRVADDGGGINLDAVRSRAVKNGLIEESASYSLGKESLLEFLFTPGFSTASSVTQISGRGVGMDVVRSTLRDMGGNIHIETEEGKGTAFELSIPFTLSVNRALMVQSGEDTYALPMSSLEALVRITKEDLEGFYKGETQKLQYGADEYDFGYLGELLQTLERPPIDTILEPTIALALFRSGQKRIALMVDEITGSQEVVVKSLSSPFRLLPGISGAAIMGDGSVVVALDMPTLINSYYKILDTGETKRIEISPSQGDQHAPVVMVVDDSVTVRKVTSRFLNRQGYIVESARDGVEALRLIHDQKPDLMLVDVEMPRMDGFELLGILRSTDKFKDLPVFLITSRTGSKHRERGLSLGAQRYFGKPYREDELIEAMNEYLAPRGNA